MSVTLDRSLLNRGSRSTSGPSLT